MDRNTGLMAALASIIIVAGVIGAYSVYGPGNPRNASALPPYCRRPAGGFLIVASSRGYNGSVDRLNFTSTGGVSAPYPLIRVQRGSNVTVVVCNTDQQAHGFEVQHYYDSKVHTIAPGQAIAVSFVVTENGTFRIYCAIPCTIHWAMQDGELVVA